MPERGIFFSFNMIGFEILKEIVCEEGGACAVNDRKVHSDPDIFEETSFKFHAAYQMQEPGLFVLSRIDEICGKKIPMRRIVEVTSEELVGKLADYFLQPGEA